MTTLNNTSIEIYTTEKVLTLNVVKPEIQRIIDLNKVQDIIECQLEFHRKNGYFNFNASGPINIHIWDGKYLLVDGQHRLEALERLYNNHSHNISFYINFVKINSQQELEFNYNMINKNTPLPDFSKFKTIDKNIPETVAVKFQLKFPDIWAKNTRARRPHVYFNFFQESLAFICEETLINCSEVLYKTVIDYNLKLKSRDKSSFKVTDNIYNKAKQTDLYLGLFQHQDEDYGYLWAKNIVEDITGRTIKKSSTSSKKKIPKKIKNDSWDKYIGKQFGESRCLCCTHSIICQKEFTAGHVRSEFNGGKITVNNIIPICSACNLSMATQNMDEYIKEYYPDNYETFRNKML